MIFFSFVRQECEKRLPARFTSVSVVFLFRASSMTCSICSEKKLSESLTHEICLSLLRQSITYIRAASLRRQELNSKRLSLVLGNVCVKSYIVSSPRKFLLQTRDCKLVLGSTSQRAWKPVWPISFKLISNSLSLLCRKAFANRIMPWSPITLPLMLRDSSEVFFIRPDAIDLAPIVMSSLNSKFNFFITDDFFKSC